MTSDTARALRGWWSLGVATPEEIGLSWRLRKTWSEATEVTSSGRAFHTRGPATGKARSPTVERRVRRTIRDVDDTAKSDLGVGRPMQLVSKVRRCCLCSHLYTRTASLNPILSEAWSWCSSGVMWSNLHALSEHQPAGRVNHQMQALEEIRRTAGSVELM